MPVESKKGKDAPCCHTLSAFVIRFFEVLLTGVGLLFVTFEPDEKKEGAFDLLCDLFREPLVRKQKIEVPGALPFYEISAKAYRGRCPWEAVENAAGALRSRMLLPPSIVPPEESGLLPFSPSVFCERLLFNTAVRSIEKMRLDPCRVSVTLFDENAYLVDLVQSLVPLAFQIRVVTACVAAYETLGEYLLEKFGISLVVSARSDDSVLSSTFIISAPGKNVPLVFPGILFTNRKERMMNAVVMTGEGFDLPQKYAPLLPEKIDPLTFAGALYELCGADELGKLRYKKMAAI